jgi:hypothetical protein
MTDTQKVKASKREFAEVLFYWLAKQVNTKAIKQTAKLFDLKDKDDKDFGETEDLFGLNLKNKKDFTKLVEELFVLNIWLIVYNCERIFEDINKRDECLDIFHHLVYQRLIEGTGENFSKWMMSMGVKYIEYDRAMKTEHHLGPLWVLSKVVNKNLFGEVKKRSHSSNGDW